MLKGIAQNLLQMNVPKIDNLKEMLKEFDLFILNSEALDVLHKESFRNDYTVFCSGLFSIEKGNIGFTMLPFRKGLSFKKFDNIEDAKDVAKTCCKFWGLSLNLPVSEIKQYRINVSMAETFICGYEKNGRYWEVHYTPNWLK